MDYCNRNYSDYNRHPNSGVCGGNGGPTGGGGGVVGGGGGGAPNAYYQQYNPGSVRYPPHYNPMHNFHRFSGEQSYYPGFERYGAAAGGGGGGGGSYPQPNVNHNYSGAHSSPNYSNVRDGFGGYHHYSHQHPHHHQPQQQQQPHPHQQQQQQQHQLQQQQQQHHQQMANGYYGHHGYENYRMSPSAYPYHAREHYAMDPAAYNAGSRYSNRDPYATMPIIREHPYLSRDNMYHNNSSSSSNVSNSASHNLNYLNQTNKDVPLIYSPQNSLSDESLNSPLSQQSGSITSEYPPASLTPFPSSMSSSSASSHSGTGGGSSGGSSVGSGSTGGPGANNNFTTSGITTNSTDIPFSIKEPRPRRAHRDKEKSGRPGSTASAGSAGSGGSSASGGGGGRKLSDSSNANFIVNNDPIERCGTPFVSGHYNQSSNPNYGGPYQRPNSWLTPPPHHNWMTKSTNSNRKGTSHLDTQLLPPTINYNNNNNSSSSSNTNRNHGHGKHKITNKVLESDTIPMKKSRKREKPIEPQETFENREETAIQNITPLPGFQQAFGSTEIGRFSEAFFNTNTPESPLENGFESDVDTQSPQPWETGDSLEGPHFNLHVGAAFQPLYGCGSSAGSYETIDSPLGSYFSELTCNNF